MTDRKSLNARWGFGPLNKEGRVDIGVLRCDIDASGDVLLSEQFLAQPAITRADVLQEILGLITSEYNRAVQEMFVDSTQQGTDHE